MKCGLLNGIWAVYNMGAFCDIWAIVWYVNSCLVCELLYGMWAVV